MTKKNKLHTLILYIAILAISSTAILCSKAQPDALPHLGRNTSRNMVTAEYSGLAQLEEENSSGNETSLAQSSSKAKFSGWGHSSHHGGWGNFRHHHSSSSHSSAPKFGWNSHHHQQNTRQNTFRDESKRRREI